MIMCCIIDWAVSFPYFVASQQNMKIDFTISLKEENPKYIKNDLLCKIRHDQVCKPRTFPQIDALAIAQIYGENQKKSSMEGYSFRDVRDQ